MTDDQLVHAKLAHAAIQAGTLMKRQLLEAIKDNFQADADAAELLRRRGFPDLADAYLRNAQAVMMAELEAAFPSLEAVPALPAPAAPQIEGPKRRGRPPGSKNRPALPESPPEEPTNGTPAGWDHV